jgi:hypothetical protein
MKTKAQTPVAKPSRARKPALRSVTSKKTIAWTGFAPELCGVMDGPKDLSIREGFLRG